MAKEKVAEEKEETGEPRVYELGFLLLPTILEEELAGKVAQIKERGADRGGVFLSEEFPKRIGLAYPIAKIIEGKRSIFGNAYFGSLKYKLSPEAVAVLEGACKRDPFLLRFLLIKTIREAASPARRSMPSTKPETPRRIERTAHRQEKPLMSEEELDRTIAELVIE